ncbi:hypothetical protein C8R44DRAFT_728274 [Mycena epipterygia]|nr:hypothetical protein C8R44DRAFT_728274 [Mycena epipterygia]
MNTDRTAHGRRTPNTAYRSPDSYSDKPPKRQKHNAVRGPKEPEMKYAMSVGNEIRGRDPIRILVNMIRIHCAFMKDDSQLKARDNQQHGLAMATTPLHELEGHAPLHRARIRWLRPTTPHRGRAALCPNAGGKMGMMAKKGKDKDKAIVVIALLKEIVTSDCSAERPARCRDFVAGDKMKVGYFFNLARDRRGQ